MVRSLRRLALALTVPALLATACTADDSIDSSSDELNYRSTAGQEFELAATVTFKVDDATQAMPAGADKDAAMAQQANGVRDTVTSAITSELDKIWPEDERTSREGVAIQFRQATSSTRDLQPGADAGTYAMTVAAEFAGVKDLLKKLPLKTENERSYLPVTVDVGTGQQELHVTVTPIERSLNAYPRYLELFADGLDVSAHFGDDHNTPRQDLAHARSLYDDLVAAGYRSPVARFEDLTIDSGPLTSTIKVKGADVPVRISIFHIDMTTPDTRQLAVDAYKRSMKTADVVIYDGHAGRRLDYSGVVLAYNPARVSIPANTFKDIESGDKQQVYLFNGCETYTGYADALYLNPSRKPENTDVITTGNFSAIQSRANQVIAFIHALVDQKSGAWVPRSWDSVLGRMNAVGERSWVHVYGVHGLDDNPRLSPLADPSVVGRSCTTDAQCGGGDSKCIPFSTRGSVCGVACADTTGCPAGTKCVLPRGKTSTDDLQCAAN